LTRASDVALDAQEGRMLILYCGRTAQWEEHSVSSKGKNLGGSVLLQQQESAQGEECIYPKESAANEIGVG